MDSDNSLSSSSSIGNNSIYTNQEQVLSLGEILGIVNNENTNNTNNTNSLETKQLNLITTETQYEYIESQSPNKIFSDEFDKRIGKYLLDELEKKQTYINELEDVIKFQEKEIGELKLKLDTFNKIDLLGKIKSSVDTKLLKISELSEQTEQTEQTEQIEQTEQTNKLDIKTKNNIVQIKKPLQNISNNIVSVVVQPEQSYTSNPDLVLHKPIQKNKPITKEEEEPKYNGIMLLEKPKRDPGVKSRNIYINNNENTNENNENTNETIIETVEIIKQRRRAKF